MKVLAINGSARKDGNTALMLRTVFKELEAEGIETEVIHLAGKKIAGCIACYKCKENQDRRCAVNNDELNAILEKMLAAEAIILASPTYIADVSAQIKALIDRTGLVGKVNGGMFQRKLGAAVVVARRGGAIHAYDSLCHWFGLAEMILVCSDYWGLAFGRNPGEVADDQEGMTTMRGLGRNLAWALKKFCG